MDQWWEFYRGRLWSDQRRLARDMYSATRTAATIPRFLTARPSTFQSFSTTSLLRAAESEKPFFNADALDEFKRSPTFEKLSRSPNALLAIQKFAKVIEKQGALQLGLVRAKLNHV